jgi:C-terminal processing protease CtpA/Prc
MKGRTALALLASLALTACGGSSGGNGNRNVATPDGCSVLGQNQFVLSTMEDIYLWYEEIPPLDPAGFDSPEALLEAIRFQPLDRFSFITSLAGENALFGSSQFAGFGFRSQRRGDTQQISEVFEESPADIGGLARGAEILAIDGRPMAEIFAEEGFSASLGPPDPGVTRTLTLRLVDGTVFDTTIEKSVVTIPPVSGVSVLDVGGLPTGYLNFRTFTEPAVEALSAAADALLEQSIAQLVIDVRYNGGGLLSVAEYLAGLLGGQITSGQVFVTNQFNDKNTFRNSTTLFRNPPNALDLGRIVFLTTPSSASASEIVINGLAPFVSVSIVGSQTFGKPVGQLGFAFCEKVLRPASFETVNADGQGDFFEGLQPDCLAEDDLTRELGDPAEAKLAEAIHLLETGSCSAQAPAVSTKPATLGPATHRWLEAY